MEKMKVTDFLSWVCLDLRDHDRQAVLMKFKFGREKAVKEISFLAVNDPDLKIIYGWSDLRHPSWETPETYYCCNAPLTSQEAYDYINNALLQIDGQYDTFPLPDVTLGIKELKYEIISLGEGALAINILSKSFHSIRQG